MVLFIMVSRHSKYFSLQKCEHGSESGSTAPAAPSKAVWRDYIYTPFLSPASSAIVILRPFNSKTLSTYVSYVCTYYSTYIPFVYFSVTTAR